MKAPFLHDTTLKKNTTICCKFGTNLVINFGIVKNYKNYNYVNVKFYRNY